MGERGRLGENRVMREMKDWKSMENGCGLPQCEGENKNCGRDRNCGESKVFCGRDREFTCF